MAPQTSSYDRSVFEPEGCIGAYNKCKCFRCEKRPVAAFSENLDSIVQFDINLRNIQEYIDGKILQPFGENSFILYEQSCATHKQRGICVALDILDFVKGNVFRHENTIASPVARAHVCLFIFPYSSSISVFTIFISDRNIQFPRIL